MNFGRIFHRVLLYKPLILMYRQKMSTACTFGSIMKLQNDIEYWKTWETNYSNTLSQNEGQRQKLESQKRLAAFMQEIKHEKLHLMREEIKKLGSSN